MVRKAKILLILAVAFSGLMGIFNFVGWSGSYDAVKAVTSMEGVPGADKAFQATENPIIVTLGVLFIALSKLTSAGFCLVGANQMWKARDASSELFQQAKSNAVVGCSILLFMLVGGFLFLSSQFYRSWMTEVGSLSSQLAFQLAGGVGLILIFVNQRD